MSENNKYHHGDLKNALIEVGIEILAKEGIGALSLRRVARRAGVSHAAPYAHFTDKQALVAAISTEGYQRLYERIFQAVQEVQGDPARQLSEVVWAYVQFALESPEHFKITFSGFLKQEKDFPEFVAISKKSFGLVLKVVSDCQEAGVLKPGDSELLAVSIWSGMHGFVSLLLENQIPSSLLKRFEIRQMLNFQLRNFYIDKE